ncbi:MAG: FAD-dependent monooxygenase, partial [Hyphomicrobiaceae bacterium]
MNQHYQVVIAGGGPVGVGLAVELGIRGIRCIVIERRAGMHNIPKGQNLTQRTLEHCYFWGCVDEVRKARIMPPSSPIGELVAYRHLDTPYWHATEGRGVVGRFYFQA